MIPACLELGGSDAFIVREDVSDMDKVVEGAIKGRMRACG
jgi:acyl-CoA reductase-like NAD-dependent aldehyde dehydrogenase